MGGSYFQHEGAAVDYLCMPENPDFNYKYKDGVSTYRGYVFGAEYESQDNDVDIDQTYLDKDVPCAVCRIIGSTSILMIPGKTKCENSWSEQYSGYLMSGRYLHKAASQYICVDKDAEVIPGSSTPTDGVLVYPVEVRCGSLKCPPYSEGRELACVVCSK
ncbi:hypothetical protein FSP39_013797 [Pinctada imbricata]|uniref:Short-chain collagen C4-like n=1 Tax=Pinctada imbricata TaxID=66713 RepID=A0AA89C5E2_PINIB|nr:hypothetical protein FSP39_013797 [Pinctada imbricata]